MVVLAALGGWGSSVRGLLAGFSVLGGVSRRRWGLRWPSDSCEKAVKPIALWCGVGYCLCGPFAAVLAAAGLLVGPS